MTAALICFAFLRSFSEITGGLDVEPELRALLEEFAEFQGHLGRDAAAAEHDFVDAAGADAEGSREGILGNAHGNEVVLKENFTGRDGGFHRRVFISTDFADFHRLKVF